MLKLPPTSRFAVSANAFLVAILMAATTQAQISRDATNGQMAGPLTANPISNVFLLDGVDGIRAGTNSEIVIHSMSEFNLDATQTARYMDSNAALLDSVTNVLTRVTGGNASMLDGRIESLYPNADLFFVNPNGVFFGANFTIDVPKSFHTSTADILTWEAGVNIDTGLPTDIPLLTAAVPLAWRFLSAGPEKRIEVDGFTVADSFDIGESEAFTFVGSELAFGDEATPVDINTNGRNVLAIALGDEGGVSGLFDFQSPLFGSVQIFAGTILNPGEIDGDFEFNGQIDTSGELQSRNGDILFWGGLTEINGSLVTASAQAQSGQNAGFLRIFAQNLQVDGLLDTSSASGDAREILLFISGRVALDPGSIFRSSAEVVGMAGGNQRIFADRLTGTDVLFDLGTNTNADIGQMVFTVDIIDLMGLEIRASSADPGRGNTVAMTGRQIRLSGIGGNSIDGSSSSPFAASGVFLNGTEFIDFRNMTINTSNSGGGNGGTVSFTGGGLVTSDANFSIDQSAIQPGIDGQFFGVFPTITAAPPAVDPIPGGGIIRDNTPEQTAEILATIDNVYRIDGKDGLRRDNDEIVIHSFERFDLEDFETARFTDDQNFLDTVVDVFARVTGGQTSQINGLIENLYTDADITFINPSGVIFGDGFALDTNASFFTVTADVLQFESGLSIDLASATGIPALDLEFAERWIFQSGGPEKQIIVNGFNVVDNGPIAPDNVLAFIGSDVTFDMTSALQSQGRDLAAIAVGTSGGFDVEPILTRPGLGVAPNGNLTLNLQASNVSNTTGTDTGDFGGDLILLGGTVDIALGSGSILATGAGTTFGPFQVLDSGDMTIIGTDIQISGQGPVTIGTESRGLIGSTVIDAENSITFVDDVRIFSRAFSSDQDAGDVQLVAGGSLSGNLNIFAGASGSGGDGGTVDLNADAINLQDLRILTNASTAGIPGPITITGRQISLDGQGLNSIFAAASDSTTSGGNILIDASETLDIQEVTINASNVGLLVGDGGFVEINSPDATADAIFAVDVSSSLGNPGTFTGTAFPMSRIMRDTTAGQMNTGAITPIANLYEINGNDGIRRGPNDSIVVHSFDQFGLDSTETARYTDDPGFRVSVTSVITRVTGGLTSQIDGTIESLYENANLFFTNPNGMIFGTGFTLDTSAAFYSSAADSLEWDPGVSINLMSTAAIPTLTNDIPLTWDFQSAGPSKQIVINGFNVVDNGALALGGEFLSFVASDLQLNTDLRSQGRSVEFLSVGSPGSLEFDLQAIPPVAPTGTVNIAGDIFTAHSNGTVGDVLLYGGDVTVNSTLDTSNTGPGTSVVSEEIAIIANTLTHTGFTNTEATTSAGNIQVFAFDSASFTNSTLSTGVLGASGNAGNISVIAANTLSSDGFTVVAEAFGDASTAGAIELNGDVIDLQGMSIGAGAFVDAQAGSITISGRQLSLIGAGADSISVSNVGSSFAGTVLISATESLDFQNLTINASNTGLGGGDGGFVQVDAVTGTADALFDVDVSSASGMDGVITGTFFAVPPVPDQIIRDLTPGQSLDGIIPGGPGGDIYEINGNDGIRRNNDSIVIHSFSEFNLESFETARYTDDPGFLASVTNVITRVTGGLSSQLDGAIESLYDNADLFFVNARGVIFGETFRINVPQSFHVSTADTLDWDAGASINTSIPDDIPALTGIIPLGWGFASGGPEKRITINGFVAVDTGDASGEEFTFVGSEIVSGTPLIFSRMSTNGRHFIGAALDGAGVVQGFAGVDDPAASLELLPTPFAGSSLGRIDLFTDLGVLGQGTTQGDVLLWGGDVSLQGSYTSQRGGGLRNGGDMTVIAADTLSFDGDIRLGGANGGQGGDLFLTSFGSMNLEGFLATGNTGAAGGGAAGNVSLTATTTITGTNLTILANGDFSVDSDAGVIAIQADLIDLDEFRLLARAIGAGDGGGISITGRDISLDTTQLEPIDVSASGSGDAGGIVFSVSENLDFQGVTLNAANTGTGNGGIIAVTDSASLIFTADAAFAFDVSAADPGASDGMFIGRMPNTGPTPPPPPPPPPPPDPLPPPDPTNEQSDVAASLDQIVSFTADEPPPPIADDSLFGGPIDEFADTEPDGSSPPGSNEEELADGSEDATQDGTLPEVSAGLPANTETSSEDDGTSEILAGFEESEPEAAVAATSASAAEEDATKVPGITLYTRAAQRAPLMPRTCDVLAKTGSGSRLLARNLRRRPISSEDWLLTFDKTGDQLIAQAIDTTPPVGSGPTADTNSSNRLVEIQRAFSAAAVAIRGDRYEEAADRFMSAVDALEETGNTGGATQALLAFAQLQFEDGRFASARTSLDRALELAEKDGDEANIAAVRQHLASALIGVGDLAGAEEELNRGLTFVLESDNKGQGPSMLNDLGNRHAAKRDYKSALWAYERAAKLAKELDRLDDEARALAGAARVAVDVSRLDDAWRFVERADRLRNMVRDTRARTSVAIHIGHTFAELASVTGDRRSDAVLKASAAFESAIRDAKAMNDDYSLALANLNLGALYQDEQHRSEALYLTRLSRKSATKVAAPELIYRAHWQEGQILWSAHRVRDALASHRRAIEILEETKPVASTGYGASDADFQRSVGGVYRDHVDLLLQSSDLATSRRVSRQLIVEARDTLEKLKGAELRDYFEDECIASVRDGGRSIQKGVAVVHTIMLPDRLELLLSLPSGIERFSSKISASRLISLVDKFRGEVQNPRSVAYQPLARRLFEVVVAPYEERLEASGVETLVFVPDGRLRTLPFVALHDGEKFLGDRYATATTLSLNLLSNRALAPEAGAPVLAGISESVQGFVALESVDEELEEIRNIEGGELLLNEDFTLERIESTVSAQAPSILHLATHAVFTGNPDTSFLLTYDGRVGFDELSDVVGMTSVEGAPLDLLVLSACETAIGNDRAGLGFTGSAIRAGARSAVGSLWPIADEAARQLMVDFYSNLQSSETTKADALRQAQASLRHEERYSHPAYWAPFTLVNDWL